ncbi:hypothetical protein BBP00_00002209 [Phytophthora kernoviae]|uniref:Alkaline phytoceramidase n=1 Tax=Phytophthora kernoviae TaxID=325452 RepID=A0A3F2RYY8_9STRA|nr:hypothetical protein BBP00_00002209 [Phytophthora kernoviae]
MATAVDRTSMRVSTNTNPPLGFWGPPTSTIDWCEINYEHSYYIAEFWNTLSNSLFVILGLYGLYRSIKMGFEPRFHLQFIGVMVTGFGSAMFHGTLQHVYQQCDETPMVWSILVWIYIVYNNEIKQLPFKHADNYVLAFLTTIGAIFTVVHAIYRFTTVFQVFFGVLAVLGAGRLCVHYSEAKDPRARAVAKSYVTSSLIGFAFWIMDYHYCHVLRGLPVNPQGHAWWHIFMGISTYHGPIFMQYVRMEQLKKKAYIHQTCMGIQTIIVENKWPDSPKKPKTL